MELFLFAFLASLADPIRWIICALSGWLVPNYAGALAGGVGVTVALSAMLVRHPSGSSLFAGAIASVLIVSAIYFWRRSRRTKARAVE